MRFPHLKLNNGDQVQSRHPSIANLLTSVVNRELARRHFVFLIKTATFHVETLDRSGIGPAKRVHAVGYSREPPAIAPLARTTLVYSDLMGRKRQRTKAAPRQAMGI
jgi:hypothetical protein